jgi:hypothetical protein
MALLLGIPAGTYAQTARVQVIHNCADAVAAEVDVYLNGDLLLDDFAFRTATGFVDAPAGTPIVIDIAPGNSMSAAESIYSQEYVLEENETYILIASGIVSPSGYSPAPAFGLEVHAGARENATGAGTDVLVFHGSTDAPMVDVFESAVVGATVVDDLSYPEFTGYLELPTLDFTLQVRTADNTAIVAAYQAPLQTLSLDGAAITVIASGFLDPSMNSNGAAFGLFVATASAGPLVALPAAPLPSPARVQVIHNSADAAAAQVDIYLNGSLLLDDFAFRTATPFVDLPSGVDLTIGVAPANSMNSGDAIAEFTYVLEEGGTYVIVASGIVSPNGYEPVQPFDLYVTAGQEMAMEAGNTDILVFHGATDAPVVDVAETAVFAGAVIVDDIAYGDFQGYLSVPTMDYILQVQTTDGTPVAAWQAPLMSLGLDGSALVVLASGFLAPANNSNGEPFGLYVALPAGGPLVALPISTGIRGAAQGPEMMVWPNPAIDRVHVSGVSDGNAEIRMIDQLGRTVMVRNTNNTFTAGENMIIDVSNLPRGSYLLETTTPHMRSTLPVVLGQ